MLYIYEHYESIHLLCIQHIQHIHSSQLFSVLESPIRRGVPWWEICRWFLGIGTMAGVGWDGYFCQERSDPWTPKIPRTHPGNHWVVDDSWNSWVIWEELKNTVMDTFSCRGAKVSNVVNWLISFGRGMVGMMVFRRKSQGALSQECNHKLLPSLSQTLSKLAFGGLSSISQQIQTQNTES